MKRLRSLSSSDSSDNESESSARETTQPELDYILFSPLLLY